MREPGESQFFDKSEGEQEIEQKEELDLLIEKKVLYHGSVTSGIQEFTRAEEDTVGSGVYFTSEPENAEGYARRRSRTREGASPALYTTEIENLKLANLKSYENLKEIFSGYRTVLQEELEKPNLPWFYQSTLQNSIRLIESGSFRSLKEVVANHNALFTKYLESLGYDGLLTVEGGEGDDIGEHDSYVIFDPTKISITQEREVESDI